MSGDTSNSDIDQHLQDINNPPELDDESYQPVHIIETPYAHFEERNDVKKQCSTGCVTLYKDFRKQRDDEKKLQQDEKKRRKEKKNETLNKKFRQLNAEAKVSTLVDKARLNLERGVNIYGGFLRTVNRDLDNAYDIIRESDNLTQPDGSRWFISDQTREDLFRLRAEEHVHNWAYINNLSRLTHDLIARENHYREVLDRHGIPQPFDTSLIDRVRNHSVLNNLTYQSTMQTKGRYQSRHHKDDIYSDS
jgi:hypothetical protein